MHLPFRTVNHSCWVMQTQWNKTSSEAPLAPDQWLGGSVFLQNKGPYSLSATAKVKKTCSFTVATLMMKWHWPTDILEVVFCIVKQCGIGNWYQHCADTCCLFLQVQCVCVRESQCDTVKRKVHALADQIKICHTHCVCIYIYILKRILAPKKSVSSPL
jgi:hypothetical protein